MKKLLIYSATFGGYDDLWPHEAICDFADYVFITDQPVNNPGHWKVVQFDDLAPAEFRALDPARKNRFVKWNTHILFPEYEYSLYVDATMDIVEAKVFKKLSRFMREGVKISIKVHTECNCVYKESKRILAVAYEDQATLERWLGQLRKEKFPSEYGLWENGLIFRRHNDPKIAALGAEVWDIGLNYSKRDQLALPYVVRKLGVDILDFNEGRHGFAPFNRWDGCFIFVHKRDFRRVYRSIYSERNELYQAISGGKMFSSAASFTSISFWAAMKLARIVDALLPTGSRCRALAAKIARSALRR